MPYEGLATSQYDAAAPKEYQRVTIHEAESLESLLNETNRLLRRLVLAMEIVANIEDDPV